MITTTWFIARNKHKFGPFSSNQLQQLATLGMVKPAEFILPEGGNKWVAASSIEGLFPSMDKPRKYWLSVGGKTQGPHLLDQIRLALLGRRLAPGTLACPEGDQQWLPLMVIQDFQDYVPSTTRDSQAHLGAGSSHLDLTGEEAELHLAGKRGDLLAKLMSTLFDLKRRYSNNPSMVEIIDKNLADLKTLRERSLSEDSAASLLGK